VKKKSAIRRGVKKRRKRSWTERERKEADITRMKGIAGRAVVNNHYTAEVRLDGADVFDVVAPAQRAVLAVEAPRKVLPVLLQPVNYWISIFLHGRGEHDQLVPFANLRAHKTTKMIRASLRNPRTNNYPQARK
jgi:hypothetical protein